MSDAGDHLVSCEFAVTGERTPLFGPDVAIPDVAIAVWRDTAPRDADGYAPPLTADGYCVFGRHPIDAANATDPTCSACLYAGRSRDAQLSALWIADELLNGHLPRRRSS